MIPDILGLAAQMERLPEVLRAVATVIAAKDAEIARLRAALDRVFQNAREEDEIARNLAVERMAGEMEGKVVSLRGARK